MDITNLCRADLSLPSFNNGHGAPCPQRHCEHECEYCNAKIRHHLKEDEICPIERKLVCNKSECELRFMLDTYKLKLIKSERRNKDLEAEAKINNTMFRVLGLHPSAIAAAVNKNELTLTTYKSILREQRTLWNEHLDIENAEIYMNCLHEHFIELSTWLGERRSKTQIKQDLIDRRAKESATPQPSIHKAKVAKASTTPKVSSKPEISDEDKAFFKTPQGKIIHHFMTRYGRTRQEAEETFAQMGIKK